MASDNIQPSADENSPDSNHPPRDDSGINNDHILDLCDFIISSAWAKYIGNNKEEPGNISIRELESLSNSLQNVWILVREIIDLDRRLRMISDFDDDVPPEFYDDDDKNDES